jgi:hypothetical protein
MILTVVEYSKKFPIKGKEASLSTIIRRCQKGRLPCNHHARQLPSESGKKGQWVIEIPDNALPEIVATKTDPTKPDMRTLNRKYFSFR